MKKKDIRNVYKQKRAALSDDQRRDFDQRIAEHFQKLSLPSIHYLHRYMPVADQQEVRIDLIIQYLKGLNPALQQIVPIMIGDDMQSFIYNDNMTTQKNQWGIEEPVERVPADIQLIHCVLVPLLAFDIKGNRVGYGKGCYDRFLADCNKEVIKIGLSYFEPVDEIADTDKFDISLDYCITPERIYEFG